MIASSRARRTPAALILALTVAAMTPRAAPGQPIAPPPPPPAAGVPTTQPIPPQAQALLDAIAALRPGQIEPRDNDALMERAMRLNRAQEAISMLRNNYPQVAARPEVRIGELVLLFEQAYLQDDAEMKDLRAAIARTLADPGAPRAVRAQAQYYELNADLAKRRRQEPPTEPDKLPAWVGVELDRRIAFARQYKDLAIGRQAFAEAVVFKAQVEGYPKIAPLVEQFIALFPADRAAQAELLAQLMAEQYASSRDGWAAAKPLADRLLEHYRDQPITPRALAHVAVGRLQSDPQGGMELVRLLTDRFPGDEIIAQLWGRLLAIAYQAGDNKSVEGHLKVLAEKFPRSQARAQVRAAMIYEKYNTQGLETALPDLRQLAADSPQAEVLPGLMAGIAIDELNKGGYAVGGPFAEQVLATYGDSQPGRYLAGVARRLKTVGQPFQMHFTSIEDRVVDVGALRGQVVVVYFWATWSPPSTAGMGKVIQTANDFRARGVVFVGVNMDANHDVVADYVNPVQRQRAQRAPMPWPNHFDGKGRANELAVQWGVADLPYFLMIDREGKLVNAGTGDREELVRLLTRLTAAPPARP